METKIAYKELIQYTQINCYMAQRLFALASIFVKQQPMIELHVIYSTDTQWLRRIKSILKQNVILKKNPALSLSASEASIQNYFQNVIPTLNTQQPLFVIGCLKYQQNWVEGEGFIDIDEFINIIYSAYSEYRFSCNFGKFMIFDRLFTGHEIKNQQIRDFQNMIIEHYSNQCVGIDFGQYTSTSSDNLKNQEEQQKLSNLGFINETMLSWTLSDHFSKIPYDIELWDRLEALNPQIQICYMRIQHLNPSYKLFQLLNCYYDSPSQSIQSLKQHYELTTNHSNVKSNQIIAINKKTKQICGFETYFLYESIYGKLIQLGNLVVSYDLRKTGLGNSLIRIICNQVKKQKCISTRFFCVGEKSEYYTKFNFIRIGSVRTNSAKKYFSAKKPNIKNQSF